jgi:hypothetical protein
VPLGELCMRMYGTVHNALVITKHVALVLDRDVKLGKSRSKIYYFLYAGVCSSDVLRSIGGCLNGALLLGEPIERSLIYKMKYSGG